MIRFQQVSLQRGVKPLLEQVDVTLNPGDKIGLIGANGAGKSSLFAMLRGELHPTRAISISRPLAHGLRGAGNPALDRPAIDTPSTATPTCANWKPNWPAPKHNDDKHDGIPSPSCYRPGRCRRLHRALARRAVAAGPGLFAGTDGSRWPASPAAGACA
jgi:energy-coupling factor transporter ATP-binding protein EcfA2